MSKFNISLLTAALIAGICAAHGAFAKSTDASLESLQPKVQGPQSVLSAAPELSAVS